MNVCRFYLIVFLFTNSIEVFATPAGPYYSAGTMIELKSFDPTTKTYEITYLKYKHQGPFYATIEEVTQAISVLNIERLERHPKDIVTNQYVLDKDMKLLAPSDLPARQDAVKKKTNSKFK